MWCLEARVHIILLTVKIKEEEERSHSTKGKGEVLNERGWIRWELI